MQIHNCWRDKFPSEWLLALTLEERIDSVLPITVSHARISRNVGEKLLAKWLAAPVFKKFPDRLNDRLSLLGLDQNDLITLLSETATDIEYRQPKIPPDLLSALTAIESFDGLQADLPEWAVSVGLERFQAACLKLIRPFVTTHLYRLEDYLNIMLKDNPEMPIKASDHCQMFLVSLVQRVGTQFLLTIALEVNIARLTGTLCAPSREERFDQFIDLLCEPENLRNFYREYPVLARQVVKTAEFWLAEAQEFTSRLARDWHLILKNGLVSRECGGLVALSAGEGDGHRHGRSVIKLTFESGEHLIYKPRSLALDKHLASLLDWVNDKMHGEFPGFPKLQAARVLHLQDHGWGQFVHPEDCASIEEVSRFYERQGALLALLHILDGTDFHSENLIAAGEHPVLLDLEGLFHPRIKFDTENHDPAEEEWFRSVMRTGLLPQRVNGNERNPGYDISGLGHRPGQALVKPELVVRDLATDEMHVSEIIFEIPLNSNAPNVEGRRPDPLSFLDQVCVGFETMGRLIIKHKEEFIRLPLAAFQGAEIRAILWDTQHYGLLLRRSFHPDYLRNGLHREYVFNHVIRSADSVEWDVFFRSERLDLLDGDIPIFHALASGCEIYDSRGSTLLVMKDGSGLQKSRALVRDFDEVQLQRQLWFIRAAYSTIPIDEGKCEWKPSALNSRVSLTSYRQILDEAVRIGHRVKELAITHEDKTGWLGIGMVSEKHWALEPSGLNLYDGTAGISLFLLYLAEISRDPAFRELARQGVCSVADKMPAMLGTQDTLRPGAFGDIGGSIYLLTHAGAMWKEAGLFDRASEIALRSRSRLESTNDIEMLNGISGFALVLSGLVKVNPKPQLLELSRYCAERILNSLEYGEFPSLRWPSALPSLAPLAGLSHGASGIAMALSRLACVLNCEQCRKASLDFVAYERSVFSQKEKNWPDFRSLGTEPGDPSQRDESQAQHRYVTTWCHGAPGIGLSRLSMLKDGLYRDDIETDVAIALETTERSGFGLNHSYCHGDLGNLELLLSAGSRVAESKRVHILSMIMDSIQRNGWLTGVPLGTETPGLMTGLSGIGFGLIRQIAPERVPSVLTLDFPIFEHH